MADNLVTITVNGEEIEVPKEQLLLHALREHGITVPTLCHDDRLTPYGGCRLCVVARRDGRGGLIPSCSTPVQPGMKIETDPPEVIASRRMQLQLLILNHRMECPVCDRRGDCRLQDLVYEYGVPDQELPFELVRAPADTQSRIIVRDPEKCIICGKCVRICEEVQGVAAIGLQGRGLGAQVATFSGRSLDCEFCGQCVNACPVAALVARPYTCEVPAFLRTSTTTTCSFCSSGCQLQLETYNDVPQAAIPAIDQGPNHGKLCVKGWLGWDLLKSSGRLSMPLVRKNGRLEEASWEEALEKAAGALKGAMEGGEKVVGLGTSRLTTEDAYLMQRFMRSVLGSPHICSGPVGGTRALVDGAFAATGVASSTAGYEDLASADLVLVLRGDPTRTHPLVKTELVQRKLQRGRDFILAHGLSGGLDRHAGLYLPLYPGSEDQLLHGVAARILERTPSLAESCEPDPGFAAWADGVKAYTPERIEAQTGIAPAVVETLVDRLLEAESLVFAVVTGIGIPGDEAEAVLAASRLLALLAGGDDARRGGLLVLGEKSNVQGIVDVGLHPRLLPGHRQLSSPVQRREIEELWGTSVPEGPGWDHVELCKSLCAKEVGVLLLVGQDPVNGWPNECPGREAVEGAGTVIVFDAFLTASARLADVVFPVRILGERTGSVVGLDARRRKLNRVFAPEGQLPQDGDLFLELSRRLGVALPEGEQLEQEISSLVSWPPEAPARVSFAAPPTATDSIPWEGVLLDVSPQLFHSGTMTFRSPLLLDLSPAVAVRVSPADADRWDLRSGELVRISSGSKEVMLRARVDRTVRDGSVVLPWSGDGSAILLESSEKALAVELRRTE